MQQYTQQGTIDDRLFVSLSEFFVNDNLDSEELGQLVLGSRYQNRRPQKQQYGHFNYFRGFVLETYVKWALSRFAETETQLFSPTQFTAKDLADGYTFNMNDQGNIEFRRYGGLRTEIDALYEFHDDSQVVPVIFEVGFMGSSTNVQLKKQLVQQLYGVVPHFCEIKPSQENENVGLNKVTDYHRIIVIPDRERFNQLATRLFERI